MAEIIPDEVTWGVAVEKLNTNFSNLESSVGDKADSSSLATVATTGDYDDLTNKPVLGTAAAQNTTAFATATQGGKADTAVQPADLGGLATEDEVGIDDLSATGTPSGTTFLRGDNVWAVPPGGGGAAWGAISGTLADQTDLQAALDAKAATSSLATVATTGLYSDLSGAPSLATVATSGDYDDLINTPTPFSGSYDDLSDKPTLGTAASADTGDFATAMQGTKADSATQPGDLGELAAKDDVAIADLSATGTPSSTTFLRGDNTWSEPSGATTPPSQNQSTWNTGTDTTESTISADKLDKKITSAVSRFSSVRQTVMTGPVDTDGRADFLIDGGGLSVDSDGLTTDSLFLSYGDGIDLKGEKNIIVEVDTDVSFTSLTDDDTSYLYLDYDTGTETLTPGSTTLAPIYSPAEPSAPASGQYWYPWGHSKRGEYWDGSAWQSVLRIFVGEVTTSSGSVASVASYAYQGMAILSVSPAASGTDTAAHNIGSKPRIVNGEVEFTSSPGGGYSIGDTLDLSSVLGGGGTARAQGFFFDGLLAYSPNGQASGSTFIAPSKTGGSLIGVDVGNVKFNFNLSRGF